MPDIRILTEGDSSVLVEFGKEISPEINRKITPSSRGLVKSDTVLQVWFFCAQQSHPLSVQLILQFPS